MSEKHKWEERKELKISGMTRMKMCVDHKLVKALLVEVWKRFVLLFVENVEVDQNEPQTSRA